MASRVSRISSALAAVEIVQAPPPLIIGERLNTQGSRAAKRMVLEQDYEGLVGLARKQVDDGAHCLDVCVATTERSDERDFMTALVKKLSMTVPAPLVIDSTDPAVIKSALRQIPGTPVINSINLEGDGSRFSAVAPLMAYYGAPAIAMCIGPDGMAATPEQKLATARMLCDEGSKYGLVPGQFLFDVLTFTLATGAEEHRRAGINTLEGIRLVRQNIPDSFTVLGLSNISFGLKPASRRVLNSVFLYHAIKYGLDCAILNAAEMLPYDTIPQEQKKLAEDLIFDAGDSALPDFVAHFEDISDAGGAKRADDDGMDPSWPPGRRANHRIVHRLKDGIREDVVRAIAQSISREDLLIESDGGIILNAPKESTHEGAVATLNEHLLPAMKEVGDKFGAGELILPFVLKSAECMKAAVSELEGYLLKKEGTSKGTLVLGTVYGDVHDIGKNLVRTIFENNGYTVHDLGKQVPLQRFLEKIDETSPDAVGLSALLVSTSKQMEQFVEHARKHSMDLPILCGGAAINSDFVNRIARQGGIYGSGVFYCGTMFQGLKIMDELVGVERKDLLSRRVRELEEWREPQARPTNTDIPQSDIVPITPPKAPHTGVPVRLGPGEIPLGDLWRLLDKKSLFKLSWGVRGKAAAASEQEHENLYTEWRRRIEAEGLFEPAAVYGFFECSARGDSLLVNAGDERLEFEFPRSRRESHLCISDYFGERDIVAFQAVTVGGRIAKLIDEWNAQDMYTDAYYLHGIAVEAAEALAEWTNRLVRRELGLSENRGLRYSWGYPSCPDISQHGMVWRLLEPQLSGMTLTESGQIVPEQSTAAMIIHHPDARYFVP